MKIKLQIKHWIHLLPRVENHFIGVWKIAISSILLPVLNPTCPYFHMRRYCNQFNHNVGQCLIRANEWLNFIDNTSGTIFILFAAPCSIYVSILEQSLSSHPDQVFAKYVRSVFWDCFDPGYFGLQECKTSLQFNFNSANENID